MSGAPKQHDALPGHAELVLKGGVIRTLDGSLPTGTALASGGGRILAVGSDTDVNAWVGPKTKVVELAGRAVVPGLADAHMHLRGLGEKQTGVDLRGTKSREAVRARVEEAIAKAKPGEWIKGRGWDQNDWQGTGGAFPTADDLDAISASNPVVLTRIDGHAVWANSAAMKALGIDGATKAPEGGKIVHKRGKPTGIFVDNAMTLIRAGIPPPTTSQLEQAYRSGQKACLETGLTQVHDMGVDATELDVLKKLDAAGELKLRVYAVLDGSAEDLDGFLKNSRSQPARHDRHHRLTVRSVKFFADGALGSRGAALLEPYADDPKNSGLILTDPAELEARVRTAEKHGFQVATHAIGDRANHMMLNIYIRVFGDGIQESRPRIEHAQVIAPARMPGVLCSTPKPLSRREATHRWS
jgi:predicted amidohydrolase YtcJ